MVLRVPFNYATLAVVTLGDGFAPIAGRLLGKHSIPYTGSTTVESSIVGLEYVFAGAVIFVFPATALIAATVGMVFELPLRITDNLTVPLFSGLCISMIRNL